VDARSESGDPHRKSGHVNAANGAGIPRNRCVPVRSTTYRSRSELPDSITGLAQRHAIALNRNRLNTEIDELVESIRTGRIRDHMARERSTTGGSL
jgi:hypothetical protein